MTPENFVYWLQGYFEILNADKDNHPKYLTNDQTQVIKDHLKLVLEKKTPVRLPYGFSPPVVDTGDSKSTDPVYYSHNSSSPPASC